jgi:integrase/recombinase XerD
MPPRRQRMSEDLQLRGLAERTQELSVRAVRQLADHSHTSPARSTEEALPDDCLSRKHVKHYSRAASTIARCGIKVFYEQPRKRAWSPRTCVRAPREPKLPVLRSIAAVRTMLAPVTLLRYRPCLTTLDSGGLRLHEGPHLQGPAMDSARLLGHVRCGKGAKDRSVPLPQATRALLRQDWTTHRHPVWRFPAPGRSGLGMATAAPPMPRTSVPEACRAARKARGLHTRASVPTLRHA